MTKTLVSFHAHPDDEAIPTGGALAKAADAGHRVVIVFATRGEHGEVAEGFLDDGETLWERRVQECHRSAEVLGAARVEFLGFVDSGMMGTPENEAPESFWQADVDEAARRLAAILVEEQADVLTVYDDHGIYGHPDHIQVHRVGVRAAELAGTQKVYEATANRDAIIRGIEEARAEGIDMSDELDPAEMANFGVPRGAAHHRGRRQRLHRSQARGHGGARQSDLRVVVLSRHAPRVLRACVRHRVVHPAGRPRRHPRARPARLSERHP